MEKKQMINVLKEIKSGNYKNINDSVNTILDIDTELNGDCEYIWGNNELFLDLDTNEWKYYSLYNVLYDMDHLMLNDMCDMLLDELK